MAIELIFETHSLTVDNEAGIATGWLPGELSPLGRELARELGRRHRDRQLAAVFVSDLARAVETAEIAFAGRHVPIRTDSRLRECNYGMLNGMPVARLTTIRRQHITEPYPGGQSYQQVVDQMRSFIRSLAAQYDDRTVLVIAHSANKWALDYLLKGRRLAESVDAPFDWQEGWTYHAPPGWTVETTNRDSG
ncbi:histidine phosphatase family protein [Mycobacterium sp. IS-3022]|uniref:histidine phosphatase family protein n=1 Tax=Mycobacterium sp. IS-3022 TaxID=1772277 RepID=UPI00074167E1|nr:histidine phosphatase family protein [Mycobacterium sp. IS-3022]KUI02879.1 hypothetical protein AU188_23880 [Mycobacterium sp. IS-3022]